MATLTENQGTIDLLRADLTAACVDRDRALKRWRDVCDALEAMRDALQRYVNADDCEYGNGPPCPGDVGVSQCMYCQASAALVARKEQS